MMSSAHSKDNGSPTSVAHKLDDDQTDSVVVRRDDLVVIDNAALGSLCEDVQIGARVRAAAGLDGAHARHAPPGAGGPVLPALIFPSRPLPEDKD